jgi:hypothetical protein
VDWADLFLGTAKERALSLMLRGPDPGVKFGHAPGKYAVQDIFIPAVGTSGCKKKSEHYRDCSFCQEKEDDSPDSGMPKYAG